MGKVYRKELQVVVTNRKRLPTDVSVNVPDLR
jgi:hypothetical protein